MTAKMISSLWYLIANIYDYEICIELVVKITIGVLKCALVSFVY